MGDTIRYNGVGKGLGCGLNDYFRSRIQLSHGLSS